jgi:hypothetical protein
MKNANLNNTIKKLVSEEIKYRTKKHKLDEFNNLIKSVLKEEYENKKSFKLNEIEEKLLNNIEEAANKYSKTKLKESKQLDEVSFKEIGDKLKSTFSKDTIKKLISSDKFKQALRKGVVTVGFLAVLLSKGYASVDDLQKAELPNNMITQAIEISDTENLDSPEETLGDLKDIENMTPDSINVDSTLKKLFGDLDIKYNNEPTKRLMKQVSTMLLDLKPEGAVSISNLEKDGYKVIDETPNTIVLKKEGEPVVNKFVSARGKIVNQDVVNKSKSLKIDKDGNISNMGLLDSGKDTERLEKAFKWIEAKINNNKLPKGNITDENGDVIATNVNVGSDNVVTFDFIFKDSDTKLPNGATLNKSFKMLAGKLTPGTSPSDSTKTFIKLNYKDRNKTLEVKGGVDPSVMKRVDEILKKLGFQIDMNASGLTQYSLKTPTIWIPKDIETEFKQKHPDWIDAYKIGK